MLSDEQRRDLANERRHHLWAAIWFALIAGNLPAAWRFSSAWEWLLFVPMMTMSFWFFIENLRTYWRGENQHAD